MIDPLAVAAHRTLGAIFMEMPVEWIPGQLLVLHRVHRVELTSWFAKNRGLAELVVRNGEQLSKTVSEPGDILDPLTLKNLAGLFALILDLYVPAFPPPGREEVEAGLENALQQWTTALAQVVDGEVVALAELFGNIVAVLDGLPGFKGHGRVILPELPVGNSIPCKLLGPVLERAGYVVDTLRVSLSRNDARSKGVRREDLLEEKLTGFGLREHDLVLYLDEWFSGVNYARICACLERLLRSRPNVQLLPAALVKISAAKAEPRHGEFVRQHDSLARRFTSAPESLRVSIPPTPSRCVADPEFFWSEHDRTSGYRKMQLLGAIFSSLDATVQELYNDRQLLLEAKEQCLAQLQEQGVDVPDEVRESNGAWVGFFEEGYRDYMQRRGDVEKLEHASNNGVFETFEEALVEVVSSVAQVVRGTAAERCMTVALLHSRRRSRPLIDPVDRFYFRTHAPLIEELTGGARRYHDLLMDSLHTRVADLLQGS